MKNTFIFLNLSKTHQLFFQGIRGFSIEKFICIMLFCAVSYTATAQFTNIPDPLFEQVLIDMEIDSDETVNGQIATSDALDVTSLAILHPFGNDEWIYDLTGIEAFTNLENLQVNGTMIEELNLNNLINLKHLNVVDNMLSTLDLSNNPLLETLYLTYGGDVMPLNSFSGIDLSHNPNFYKLVAYGINYINLKNENNNPNMELQIRATGWGYPPDYIVGHICIEVDDENAAQNNDFPYSEWIISHAHMSYSLVSSCTASTKAFSENSISLYPNPVKEHLTIETKENLSYQIFSLTGRELNSGILEREKTQILLSNLASGVYLLKLKNLTGQAITVKLIKK
ncbi:MAG TPA: T9SS type A sorting domain-containing protein [Salinimicrobium sp.]|nr:T9SS type A sorting domain-containing protein [Salinimicrobium sp.]